MEIAKREGQIGEMTWKFGRKLPANTVIPENNTNGNEAENISMQKFDDKDKGIIMEDVHNGVEQKTTFLPSNRSEEDKKDINSSFKLQIEPNWPLSLKFEDIKYKINGDKYILHGISGAVNPGEFLALMGPSGSGKTTLLNLLSGRLKSNINTANSITYNGRPYASILKRRIGFVAQDDVVFSNLTVKETLTYSAFLRLPKILTKQQKLQRALDVIAQLGLERSQNTVVGGQFLGGPISGGERKRLCIGQEILLNPSLLCLDEPTSGLDSTTALRILQILQNMAKAGMTVICTIHQPSSKMFSKFDKLILLGKGSSLYFGKASEAMSYFSSIGCSPLIPMNPAEFLIDLANGNINDKSFPSYASASPTHVHKFLVEAYDLKVDNMMKPGTIDEELDTNDERIKSTPNETCAPTATWLDQFSILVSRSFKQRRHEYLSFTRITQVTATAIIVGMLWWNNSHTNELEDQEGLLYFISVFWCFFPLFIAIFTFPQEREMLGKERAVGMYRISAYFAARNISDLGLDLLMPTIFLFIVYFMVGLKMSFSAFTLTMLTVFLSIVASQGLGLCIGAAFMDVKKAATFASIVLMTFMLSGGFFLQKVPWFMSWMRYVSFNYYTYRLLLKIQGQDPCLGQPGNSCMMSPMIEELKLDESGTQVAAMMVMIVAYRVLSYLFLRNMRLGNLS